MGEINMISQKDRILNQLLGTIYTDKKDNTVFRIQLDNALKIFIEHNLIIPIKQYEATLENLLNAKLPGKTQVTQGTKFMIAQAMYKLATEMSVSKDDITKYHIMNKEDIVGQKD